MATRHHNRVKVWCRLKPTANFSSDTINISPDNKTINIHLKRDATKGVINHQITDWSFTFNGIFNNIDQETVFETVAKDLVSGALNGYNGTLMCYGQTGSGKTFTMSGVSEHFQNRGLIPRALTHLFKEIEGRQADAINVRISYLEIYNEKMYDLLAKFSPPNDTGSSDKLVIVEKSDGVYVRGLSYYRCQTEEDALNLLFEGETNRAIGEHSYNRRSTRSHCIFSVYIETRSLVATDAKFTVSKLNFVDLAGSERIGKTESNNNKLQMETQHINKSQSFLRQVVMAMADENRKHIPFRQSKLTHFLKDSVGGNCNTVLIANIWSEPEQIDETVSTLRFATHMMCVPMDACANEHYDPELQVKIFRQEISSLKMELAMHDTLNNRTQVSYEPITEQQRYFMKQQMQKYLDGLLEEIDIQSIRQIQGYFSLFRELYGNLEKTVEENFRQRYTLIDRTDPAAIVAAQKAGIAIKDDGTLVGELDGSSFGVGLSTKAAKCAPSDVVQLKKGIKEKEKKTKPKDHHSSGNNAITPNSPRVEKEHKSPSASPPGTQEKKAEDKEAEIIITPLESDLEKLAEKFDRPTTPPNRTVAFEEFKAQQGVEINRILTENKGVLFAKKKLYAECAKEINKIKGEIDECKKYLENYTNERHRLGVLYDKEGEEVLSEEEYQTLKQLKQLKNDYRLKFDEYKSLRNEVFYCQKLVDQCRQRLIQDFDNWFAESFLSPGTEISSKDAGYGMQLGLSAHYKIQTSFEDEQEKYERIHNELLKTEPDLAPYHNAMMMTQRRQVYRNAISKTGLKNQ